MRWVAVVIYGETMRDLDLTPGGRVEFGVGYGEDAGIGSICATVTGGYTLVSNTHNSVRFGFSGNQHGIRGFHPSRRLEEGGVRDGIAYFQLPAWWPRNRKKTQ
jgi:hypothetical protein